ncbi:MAG: hypothetical protein ACPF8V_02480 [Luteibaculum sp.]
MRDFPTKIPNELESREFILLKKQLVKDFLPVEIELTPESAINLASLLNLVQQTVQALLEQNPEMLFSIIYKIDIPEEIIKKAIITDRPSEKISRLIVLRAYQKIFTRLYFGQA